MPTYEYKCNDCGVEFEAWQKIGASAPPCESCGGERVERLISGGSFVLKGGGWYKDGYASAGGASKSSATESSSSTSSESSGSSTSDKSSSSSTSSKDGD